MDKMLWNKNMDPADCEAERKNWCGQKLITANAILETMLDGLAVIDLKGNIIQCNNAYARMHKFATCEEMMGINLSELIAKKDRQRVADDIKRCTEIGVTVNFEHLSKGKDGKEFPSVVNASVMKDGTGKVIGIVGVVRDITERKKTENLLQTIAKRYSSMYSTSRDAIMTIEPPLWKFTSGNAATMQMFRAKNGAEFLACEPWKLSPKLQPDGRLSIEKSKEMIEIAMREGSNLFEWVHQRLNGEVFFAEVLLSRVDLDEQVFIQALVRDITERKKIEDAVIESEARFRGIVSLSHDAILVVCQEGKIGYMNPAAKKIFNQKVGDFINESIDLPLVNDKIIEINTPNPGKCQGVGEVHITETEWLNKTGYLITVRDITEQKCLFNKLQQSEQALKQLAEHDVLTGLPNRYQFKQVIDRSLAAATRHNTALAVLLMDLDKFKEVNDTCGHDVGDLLLKEFATRLLACSRKEDFVARLGGDEFVMLATYIKTPADVSVIAQKILKTVKQEYVLNGHKISISVSIGVAFFPKDADNRDALLKKADIAMYDAKRAGKDKYQIYKD